MISRVVLPALWAVLESAGSGNKAAAQVGIDFLFVVYLYETTILTNNFIGKFSENCNSFG